MIDFFRDPAWQFVGALLAVLAIAISIILFFAQRKRKALSYEIVSKTTVLSAAEEISGKLQILFQGEAVKNVHLLVLKLSNTGNIPITSGDFEREVSLKFDKSERILSAEISETTPSNLSAVLQVNNKIILLKPVLLNPGDTIVIKTLISGFDDSIEVDGRIVGVTNVEKRVESMGWSLVPMVLGLIMIFIGATGLSSATPSPSKPFGDNPITVFLFLGGYVVSIFGMMSNRRSRAIAKEIIQKFSSVFFR